VKPVELSFRSGKSTDSVSASPSGTQMTTMISKVRASRHCGMMPCEKRAEAPWLKAIRICLTRNDGEGEDVEHLIMQYLSDESLCWSILVDVRTVFDRRSNVLKSTSFDAVSRAHQCESSKGSGSMA
jgi:hypothetical protein